MDVSERLWPGATVVPKVTDSLPVIPAADVVAQPLPPQALLAAVLVVRTPLPRVNPMELIKPVAAWPGGSGEVPKFIWPLTSQASTTPFDAGLVTDNVVEA